MYSYMNKKYITVISVLMVVLVAVVYFFFDQSGKEIIEDYTKLYDISLIDSEFENQGYENKFIEYQDKLKDAIKNYDEGGFVEEEKPSVDFFIEKARYANYLGQTDWAIEILNGVFNYYENSSVAWNNLAKLYEEKGEYLKANEYYQKLIDIFAEKQFWSVYYHMVKNSLLVGDKDDAIEYYERYKSRGGYSEEIEELLTE